MNNDASRVRLSPSAPISPSPSARTTQEVARWLGLSSRTICLWAECGEIPGFKVGRQWRFEVDALETWLRGKGGALVSQFSTYARPTRRSQE
ncbi:MAG: helix-turn-helix domain-containing protein [Acidobacteriia bacterium]|nr:helix-turn-helix domain-containing protein [Terriglobia bacterium]